MLKLVSLDKIRPAAYNPRVTDRKRLEILKLSIQKLGFILPLYADSKGELLSGHQRSLAAEELGIKKVPVYFLDKEIKLDEKKAINIVFNRATNDFRKADEIKKLTSKLEQIDLQKLADKIEDKRGRELYRCLYAKISSPEEFAEPNRGRWNQNSTNLAKTLYTHKIMMPIIINQEKQVINGIGRLEMALKKKFKELKVVQLSPEEEEFAHAMLNMLSMDFDIHNKYEDLLRYNSFRRSYTNRPGLGKGFFVHRFGGKTTKAFQLRDYGERWKEVYGDKIIDFGAGKLTDTKMLRGIGVDVNPFEPYLIKQRSNDIDIEASRKLNREFLRRVATGEEYSSIFISSVFNSVPFMRDRMHIAHILAALAGENAPVYLWTMSTKHTTYYDTSRVYHSETAGKTIKFKLEYEPGIALGDYSKRPKVQKYHTEQEIVKILLPAFKKVQTKIINANVASIAQCARLNIEALRAAIDFEFELPYPGKERMGLSKYAKECFSKRLNIKL